MSEEHHVFDAPTSRSVTIYCAAEPPPDRIAVVVYDALATENSSPNPPDTVTIAGPEKVVRGKVVEHAYVIEVGE